MTKKKPSATQLKLWGTLNPVLPFLVFFGEFLVFSPFFEELLGFLSVFPFFSRDFRGPVGIKNPRLFGWFFSCLFPKKQGKEGQGRQQTQQKGVVMWDPDDCSLRPPTCSRVRGGSPWQDVEHLPAFAEKTTLSAENSLINLVRRRLAN